MSAGALVLPDFVPFPDEVDEQRARTELRAEIDRLTATHRAHLNDSEADDYTAQQLRLW